MESIITAYEPSKQLRKKIRINFDELEGRTNGLHTGTGAPGVSLGSDGEFYFRKGGLLGSRIYIKVAGAWVGIL